MDEILVKFVSKEFIPPNVTQGRPIENFRAQKICEGDWESNTESSS